MFQCSTTGNICSQKLYSVAPTCVTLRYVYSHTTCKHASVYRLTQVTQLQEDVRVMFMHALHTLSIRTHDRTSPFLSPASSKNSSKPSKPALYGVSPSVRNSTSTSVGLLVMMKG